MPRIPALTLSGGKLSDFGGHKAAREYRFWVHPGRGDDYYYAYKTYSGATAGRARIAKRLSASRIEKVIAVVYDAKYKKY